MGAERRGRLEQAALELYGERGFEQTTVAEIAERAGLTERTFFRHFADKREVLFGGSGALQELLVTRRRRRARLPRAPIDAVAAALEAAGALLPASAASSPGSARRHRRERGAAGARADQARRPCAAALADALRERGVAEPAAS